MPWFIFCCLPLCLLQCKRKTLSEPLDEHCVAEEHGKGLGVNVRIHHSRKKKEFNLKNESCMFCEQAWTFCAFSCVINCVCSPPLPKPILMYFFFLPRFLKRQFFCTRQSTATSIYSNICSCPDAFHSQHSSVYSEVFWGVRLFACAENRTKLT